MFEKLIYCSKLLPNFGVMGKMHATQEKLLKLLRENVDNPLTMNELGRLADIPSPGLFYHHLKQLERKGYLKRNPDNPKDYAVMDVPDKAVVYLNKYGLAQCGPNGTVLDGRVIDRVPVPTSLLRFPASEAFIVEAKGDSMKPKIIEGDIVVARAQNYYDPGDMVVCVFQEKAMIKKVVHIGKEAFLFSINEDNYEPIKVVNPAELVIEGVVKNIIRNFAVG